MAVETDVQKKAREQAEQAKRDRIQMQSELIGEVKMKFLIGHLERKYTNVTNKQEEDEEETKPNVVMQVGGDSKSKDMDGLHVGIKSKDSFRITGGQGTFISGSFKSCCGDMMDALICNGSRTLTLSCDPPGQLDRIKEFLKQGKEKAEKYGIAIKISDEDMNVLLQRGEGKQILKQLEEIEEITKNKEMKDLAAKFEKGAASGELEKLKKAIEDERVASNAKVPPASASDIEKIESKLDDLRKRMKALESAEDKLSQYYEDSEKVIKHVDKKVKDGKFESEDLDAMAKVDGDLKKGKHEGLVAQMVDERNDLKIQLERQKQDLVALITPLALLTSANMTDDQKDKKMRADKELKEVDAQLKKLDDEKVNPQKFRDRVKNIDDDMIKVRVKAMAPKGP